MPKSNELTYQFQEYALRFLFRPVFHECLRTRSLLNIKLRQAIYRYESISICDFTTTIGRVLQLLKLKMQRQNRSHPFLRHRGTVNYLNNTSKVSGKTFLCPWGSFIRSRIRGSCQQRHSIIPLRTKPHLLAKGYVDTHLQCE